MVACSSLAVLLHLLVSISNGFVCNDLLEAEKIEVVVLGCFGDLSDLLGYKLLKTDEILKGLLVLVLQKVLVASH